jgi:hypothetical protein
MVNMFKVAAEARSKFEVHLDLPTPFAEKEQSYEEFTARVLRRFARERGWSVQKTYGRQQHDDGRGAEESLWKRVMNGS